MPEISSTASDSDVLTRDEAAERLRVGLTAIDALIKRRELRAFKVGPRVRIRRSDLEAFIANAA
jgi:excisionase family DNA binding protein